jgi:hypothetical protein
VAQYEIVREPGYFGWTSRSSAPMLYPPGSVIEMPDGAGAPCSLYWKPLDDAARSAIAVEQQRQLALRGGLTGWSAWGGCLPHGVGGTAETTDGGPPAENWPPPPPPSAAPAARRKRGRP